MAHLEYFPEEQLDLEREVRHPEHAALQELLANHPANNFHMKLAEIAKYCDICLDGTYYPEEINKLCKILTKRLHQKRTGVITLNPKGVV